MGDVRRRQRLTGLHVRKVRLRDLSGQRLLRATPPHPERDVVCLADRVCLILELAVSELAASILAQRLLQPPLAPTPTTPSATSTTTIAASSSAVLQRSWCAPTCGSYWRRSPRATGTVSSTGT